MHPLTFLWTSKAPQSVSGRAECSVSGSASSDNRKHLVFYDISNIGELGQGH